MGVVWAGEHVVSGRPVALKFVKSSADEPIETRKRFLREARAASAVRHPGVVEVQEVLELDDGLPVIVMELLQGETLAAHLERNGPRPLAEAASIMVPVCAAVGSIHALGIVHRDLKPENIFLVTAPVASPSTDIERGRPGVKVLDFGIAKLTALDGDAARSGDATTGGLLLGTPFYMAPEQMFGEKDIDYRADLWALGIILYETLSGKRPTQGSNLGQILKIVAQDGITPLREQVPRLPEVVLDLVDRLLERERERRLGDLRQVIAVLSAYTDVAVLPFGRPRIVAPLASAPTSASAPSTGRRVLGDRVEARAPDGSEAARGADGTQASTPWRSKPAPAPLAASAAADEIRVKGSVILGVLQASAEVDPRWGPGLVVAQVGRELSACLKAGGPMAATWYPIAWHREILGLIAAQGGTAQLREVIRRATRGSVGKIHRVVVRVLSPDVLISRSSSIFSSFFEGTFTAQPQGNGRTELSWKGCRGFDRNCWLAQIHTVEEMVAMSRSTIVRRTVTRGGGDRDAVWALELVWK